MGTHLEAAKQPRIGTKCHGQYTTYISSVLSMEVQKILGTHALFFHI